MPPSSHIWATVLAILLPWNASSSFPFVSLSGQTQILSLPLKAFIEHSSTQWLLPSFWIPLACDVCTFRSALGWLFSFLSIILFYSNLIIWSYRCCTHLHISHAHDDRYILPFIQVLALGRAETHGIRRIYGTVLKLGLPIHPKSSIQMDKVRLVVWIYWQFYLSTWEAAMFVWEGSCVTEKQNSS